VSRTQLERAPIHAALAGDAIFTNGLGSVIISRRLPDERIAIGVFLVDAYCLGVKDAFFTVAAPDEYDAIIRKIAGTQQLDPVSPAYARKLIEGAIAYARNLGFEPHEDFHDASVVLGDIDPAACAEVFTFGRDGKPFYVDGPSHSEQKARQIINRLRARCGEGGFHFLVKADNLPWASPLDDETEPEGEPEP
jgi:hypothetical protein